MTAWLDAWGGVWVRVPTVPHRHIHLGVWSLVIQREPLRRAWLRLVRRGNDIYALLLLGLVIS